MCASLKWPPRRQTGWAQKVNRSTYSFKVQGYQLLLVRIMRLLCRLFIVIQTRSKHRVERSCTQAFNVNMLCGVYEVLLVEIDWCHAETSNVHQKTITDAQSVSGTEANLQHYYHCLFHEPQNSSLIGFNSKILMRNPFSVKERLAYIDFLLKCCRSICPLLSRRTCFREYKTWK